MEKKCIKCENQMFAALLNTNAAFCIESTDKKAKPHLCNVDVFVCPHCGYVDMYAEEPAIFQ